MHPPKQLHSSYVVVGMYHQSTYSALLVRRTSPPPDAVTYSCYERHEELSHLLLVMALHVEGASGNMLLGGVHSLQGNDGEDNVQATVVQRYIQAAHAELVTLCSRKSMLVTDHNRRKAGKSAWFISLYRGTYRGSNLFVW